MNSQPESAGEIQVRVQPDQLPILASLLAGCWLSRGFRDPSILGVQVPLPSDEEKYEDYFYTCRVVFEQVLASRKITYKPT